MFGNIFYNRIMIKQVPEPDERWRAADLSQVKRLYRHSHFEIPKSKWQFGDISVNTGSLAKSFAKMIQGRKIS